MGLRANPDFRGWLDRFAARHRRLEGDPPAGVCDGCGDALADPPTPLPYCLVCLAEQYGRDRAEAAVSVAAALRVALATAPEPPAPPDLRAAVEAVLDDYEAGRSGR